MLNAIPDGGVAAVDQELGYAIMGEMQLLQEHIYFGRIAGDEPVRAQVQFVFPHAYVLIVVIWLATLQILAGLAQAWQMLNLQGLHCLFWG
jgi:hypothetical protein